jgi:hypothetical protein
VTGHTAPQIAVWGGLECTINRVGDRFLDQLAFCGHYSRDGDIDAIARLGITALRYGSAWRRMASAVPTGVALTAR